MYTQGAHRTSLLFSSLTLPLYARHRTQAQWLADAGADYLKEDSCCGDQDHTVAFGDYAEMRDALNATGAELRAKGVTLKQVSDIGSHHTRDDPKWVYTCSRVACRMHTYACHCRTKLKPSACTAYLQTDDWCEYVMTLLDQHCICIVL